MRKLAFVSVLMISAGIANASRIVNANGSADTNVTAINTATTGDRVGVVGKVLATSGIGTGMSAEGKHYGLKISAGPGTGYQVRGANITAVGGAGVYDVWGTQTYVTGDEWTIGHDVEAYGGLPIGYRAIVSGPNDAVAFQANSVYGGGNAYGLQLYNGAYSNFGNAVGASLNILTANSGDATGVEMTDVTAGGSAYGLNVSGTVSSSGASAYGVNISNVSSPSSQAYGMRVANVFGLYDAYGYYLYGSTSNGYAHGLYVQNVNAQYGATGAGAGASTIYGSGIGLSGYGYSENGNGIGVYGYGSTTYGTAIAGAFDGDLWVSSSICNPCSPSDEKFKKNIAPLNGGLKTVMALKPKTYEMKTDEYKDKINLSKGKQRGFLAQEVEAVLPDMVHEVNWPARLTEDERKRGVRREGTKYKGLNYTDLIPVLVQAIQEQEAKIQALEARLAGGR